MKLVRDAWKWLWSRQQEPVDVMFARLAGASALIGLPLTILGVVLAWIAVR